jgi:hypothetical protein
LKNLTLILSLVLFSCSSINVTSDYDKSINYSKYNSYAFLKKEIDSAELNDLDKKRFLKAIESSMNQKGFLKSNSPNLLVSFKTNSKEEIVTYNNNIGFMNPYGFYNWYWGPNYMWNTSTTSTETIGILYINFIDAQSKELVWQGKGSGYISTDPEKKTEHIFNFVNEILSQYPPNIR